MPSLEKVFRNVLYDVNDEGNLVGVGYDDLSFSSQPGFVLYDGFGNVTLEEGLGFSLPAYEVGRGGFELFGPGGGVFVAPFLEGFPASQGLEVIVFDVAGEVIRMEMPVNVASPTPPLVPVSSADVIAGPTMDFNVFWTEDEDDPDGRDVFRQRYDIFGNAIGGREQINTVNGSTQDNVVAADFLSGRYAAVWESDPGGNTQIKIRFYRPNDTAQTGERRVNLADESSDDLVGPHIEVLNGQRAVVGYTNATDGTAMFRIFNQFGAATGDPIKVNRASEDGTAILTDVTATADGGFYAAYLTVTGVVESSPGVFDYTGDFNVRKFFALGVPQGPADTVEQGIALGTLSGSQGLGDLPVFGRDAFTVFELNGGGIVANGRVYDQGSAGRDVEFLSGPGVFDANDGNDVVIGSAGPDEIHGGEGADRLFGEGGDDILRGGPGEFSFSGDPRQGLYGGNGNDLIFSGDDADVYGGFGDDLLRGTGEGVALFGEGGNDRIFVRSGFGEPGTAHGGDGHDVLRLGQVSDWTAYGGTGDDVIVTRTSSSNTFFGDAGDDLIRGGFGSDEIYGGDGNDHLYSGSAGTTSADLLFGDAGNDFLFGNSGAQILEGGAGADRLNGSFGDDILTGGAGRDQFAFMDTEIGLDTITDYTDGLDRFRVSTDLAADFGAITVDAVGSTALLIFETDISVVAVVGAAGQIDAGDFIFVP